MSQIPASQPRQRTDLPIWETACASYRSVFVENLNYLPNAVVAPFVISLIVGFIASRVSADFLIHGGRQATAGQILGLLVIAFLSMVPYVLFAVVWHRLILLGPTRATPTVIPTWTNRHWRFLGYFLLLSLLNLLLGMIVIGLPTFVVHLAVDSVLLSVLVAIATSVVALAIALRLSLVWPAVAVEMPYTLGDAFRQSQKQGLRLVAAIVLITIPLIVFNVVTQWLIPDVTTQMASNPAAILSASVSVLIWIAVYTIINYLAMAVGVSFLSLSFRHLTGWRPNEADEATPAPPSPPSGDAGFHTF